jgi:hypothetical protein
MLTCRYTSRDKSGCAIDLALLFTCNNPELQDDASELFVDLQMDIPLVRESASKSDYAYLATNIADL